MTVSARARRALGRGALAVVLWVVSLVILIPFWMMLIDSFKDARESALPSIALPSTWHFENYAVVFQRGGIGRSLANSVLVTGSSVLLTAVVAAAAALYLARKSTRSSRLIYNAFSIGLIAPLSIIPTIKLMQFLHINNTYGSVIVLMCAVNLPVAVFLCTAFVKTIPRELDEASSIDGSNSFTLLWRVILPLMQPVIMTVAILVFMAVWNSFMIPLYFLNNSARWTLPLTVYGFFGRYSHDWNLVDADLIITALPVVIFYMISQRYIISGMTAGAVKG
ncbi:MAG TPA: carbohydrate ABC transporter permease [Spirochaetia bacterium]|nr:carbohydrate ABC transporter permease [Spirochaetia bacterium]